MTLPSAWKRWIADLHLWLSLAVGLQVLAWMVSGLFMVSFPIERVRSEHRVAAAVPMDLAAEQPLLDPATLLARHGQPVQRLVLERVAGRPAYVLESAGGAKALLDARTGERLSPISEMLAREIAEAAIAGEARVATARLISEAPPLEYRGALPVWRLDFADADALSVYVEADSGRISARRSDLWRGFDLMWALHIMDYRDREDFNHPLLVVVTALSLLMTLAGLVLLCLRLPIRLRRRKEP